MVTGGLAGPARARIAFATRHPILGFECCRASLAVCARRPRYSSDGGRRVPQQGPTGRKWRNRLSGRRLIRRDAGRPGPRLTGKDGPAADRAHGLELDATAPRDRAVRHRSGARPDRRRGAKRLQRFGCIPPRRADPARRRPCNILALGSRRHSCQATRSSRSRFTGAPSGTMHNRSSPQRTVR